MRRGLLLLLSFTMVLGNIATLAAEDDLGARISALTTPFQGAVMLYAKNLRSGREFALGADTKVRTASTIKLPILCALESLVATGKVRTDERKVLKPDDKVTG